MKQTSLNIIKTALLASVVVACGNNNNTTQENKPEAAAKTNDKKYLSEPLVTHMYTADPSAHVFNGRIYIYPSHDTANGATMNDDGGHFNMVDYHVFSMDSVGGKVTDHGLALHIKDVPWAGRQMWAPDAAERDGKYYLYFPAKDKQDIFRIGVAVSDKPEGPFVAEKEPIKGSYSMDPTVFKDEDGSYYLYMGGIWGGQLQNWNNNQYGAGDSLRKPDQLAKMPVMAKLNKDMKSLAEPVKEIQLLDANGKPFYEKDNDKRFFEAAWVHKYNGKYYLSYSTGDTHNICYAIGDNPYGPFTYQDIILKPVEGWTNHHSIAQHNGKWYLFYHDSQLSGETNLRNIKVTELHYNSDGSIKTIDPFVK